MCTFYVRAGSKWKVSLFRLKVIVVVVLLLCRLVNVSVLQIVDK